MEYLSKLLQWRITNLDFNYHPKCTNLKISHLAFIDDLILMARRDNTSVDILLQGLEEFGSALGLQVNVMKSTIYTSSTIGSEIEQIWNLTQIPKGTLRFIY